MAISCTVTEIFSVHCWRELEIWVMGRSRSLKMAPIDRSYATYYWSVIVTIPLYCTVFELFYAEIYVTDYSRSLEMGAFDRSHTNSYQRSIVTTALSCIVCEM